MKFEDALTQYVDNNIGRLEEKYKWKIPLKLPIEVKFSNENRFHKNITLRKALHDGWKTATQEQRREIIEWYISDWGGVRTNSEEKLKFYASSTPEQLIEWKAAGIASWSKALSVVDPSRFAIFDARVSSAINSIQIIQNVSNPRYFPDLPSRNNKIVSATAIAKSTVKKKWESASKETFYQEYNTLLGDIAANIGRGATLQTVEMVLFAFAEDLADEASLKLAIKNLRN